MSGYTIDPGAALAYDPAAMWNASSSALIPEDRHDDRLNMLAWGRRYLPNHIAGISAQFHLDLEAALETWDRIALAAPRGHAKSTVANLLLALYRAAVYREPYILIVGDTEEQAKNHLGRIQKELLENERLTNAYPHLKLPEGVDYRSRRVKRAAAEYITIGGIKFQAKGAGQSLRGLIEGHVRPTLILVDDLENETNTATARARKKLAKWFFSTLSNLFGARGGLLVVIGTILHRDGLLANLTHAKKGPPTYWKRVYKAIEDGVPLWPSEWTLERLEKKRAEIKSGAFLREYMNDPVDEDRVLWREEWIERNRIAPDRDLAFDRLIVSIDPNTVGGDGLDDCGILVQGRYTEGATVRGLDGELRRPKPQVATIADYSTHNGPIDEPDDRGGVRQGWGRIALDAYFTHDCDAIVAEKNQGGKMVVATLRAALRDNEHMPNVILVNARRGKTLRAEPVAVLDQEGRAGIRGRLDDLEDQLISWGQGAESPGRLDAYVHGITHLIIKNAGAVPDDDDENQSWSQTSV